ncbi:DNA gyrase inhibitor YacG [Paeniroseomonas aquatica]|uniref:DNA gyrase inhibitor YacG n=1 Tax=Paeniroseomonas aquatica TaxID=373043 RepID=A0ABT8AEB4_9PROT|nr:DNA gyrase inhibitor YacG [Paeniroseomonas aquatica]MDN3568000.1 DNA gyrase inhibitor YacG [Paeniroseomonas aquatica]
MADEAKTPAARPCAVCGKPVAPGSPFRPFCSARCRQVDLGRWLAGDYAIPGDVPDLPEDDDTGS